MFIESVGTFILQNLLDKCLKNHLYSSEDLLCVEDAIIKNGTIHVQTYLRESKTGCLYQVHDETFRYREYEKAVKFATDEISMLCNYCSKFRYNDKQNEFSSELIISGSNLGFQVSEMKLDRNDIIRMDIENAIPDEFSFTMFDKARAEKYKKAFTIEKTAIPSVYGAIPDESGNLRLSYKNIRVVDFSKFGHGIPIRSDADMQAGTLIRCSANAGACPLNEKDIGAYILGITLKDCNKGEIVGILGLFGVHSVKYEGGTVHFYRFNHALKMKTVDDAVSSFTPKDIKKMDVQFVINLVKSMLIKLRDIDNLRMIEIAHLLIETPNWKTRFQIKIISHGRYEFQSLLPGEGEITEKLITTIENENSLDIIQAAYSINDKHFPEGVIATILKSDITRMSTQRKIEKIVNSIREGIQSQLKL